MNYDCMLHWITVKYAVTYGILYENASRTGLPNLCIDFILCFPINMTQNMVT